MLSARAYLGWGIVGIVAAATPLLAAPSDTVRNRIDGYRELGASFKSVNDSLRGPSPQLTMLRMSARQIVSASRAQYSWFPAGSGAETRLKTAAKPEIWSQSARFRAAQDAFATQATVFAQAVNGTNADAIRAEARKLGQTCKSCHDSFRRSE